MNDSNINVEILLSSDLNYEELTAEIFFDGEFIALLNQDAGIDNLKIEFPAPEAGETTVLRKMDLSIFEEALILAKKKIQGSK
jgi:hypothetical protein